MKVGVCVTAPSFCGVDKISKRINDPHFKDLEELSDHRFEVMAGKHQIIMDTPIQIGCAVYQLAKLRMLQFYYDCLDKYVEREAGFDIRVRLRLTRNEKKIEEKI